MSLFAQGFDRKKCRNLDSCFSEVSFKGHDYRTISTHGIQHFVTVGQVLKKINMSFHSKENKEGTFKRPHYGQTYFLCSENTVNKRLEYLRICKLRSIQAKVRLYVI